MNPDQNTATPPDPAAWRWYDPDDVTGLTDDEYARIQDTGQPYEDYDRAYHRSHGRFQCVVRELDGTYTVVYDHRGNTPGYHLRMWDRLCHWCDLLLAAGIVTGCEYPTNPDHPAINGSRDYFNCRFRGIRDKDTAIVIKDTVFNHVYECDGDDRLGHHIENLERLVSAMGLDAAIPATHLSERQRQRLANPPRPAFLRLVPISAMMTNPYTGRPIDEERTPTHGKERPCATTTNSSA